MKENPFYLCSQSYYCINNCRNIIILSLNKWRIAGVSVKMYFHYSDALNCLSLFYTPYTIVLIIQIRNFYFYHIDIMFKTVINIKDN